MLNEMNECTIAFSPERLEQAKRLAIRRRSESRNCRDRKVSERDPLFIDTIGVMAEMAGCDYLGLPYVFTVNTFRAPDLPFEIEVRATEWRNGHCKVRPDDADSRRVVMAIVTSLESPVVLAGWIMARDGKQFPTRDPHGASMPWHFVPQSALNPMSELRALVKISQA